MFQPDRPMYAITDASSGNLSSHSSATSRVAPPLTPTESAPRKAKILPRSPSPTLMTGWSWSHGLSGQAPGLARQ